MRTGLLSRNPSNQELRGRTDAMADVGGGHHAHGLAPASDAWVSPRGPSSSYVEPGSQGTRRDHGHHGRGGSSPGGSGGVVGVVSEMMKPLVTGGGGGDGLTHPGDGDGLGHVMKGSGGHGVKRMPPAVRLALVTWIVGCALVIARVYSQADERIAGLANLYYQAPAIVLMALWLWVGKHAAPPADEGCLVTFSGFKPLRALLPDVMHLSRGGERPCHSGTNLWMWARMRLEPHPLIVFELDDSRVHLSHRQVFNAAAWCSAVFVGNVAVFLRAAVRGHDSLAAWMPVLLYAAAPVVIFSPWDVWHARSRRFFARTMWRMVTPVQPISFADFFLADIACSMAKSFSDVERAVCSMLMGAVMDAADNGGTCGSTSWKIPMALAVPSIVRLLQCLRQYRDTDNPSCLWNALKYSSAFPVIVLSALKYHVSSDAWHAIYRPAWLACSLVNSLYSYYWDIKHDWDLTLFGGAGRGGKDGGRSDRPPKHPFLRHTLIYGAPEAYYFAMVSNFLLRISWTYKLSAHLRHNSGTIMLVTALEITRRFQWSLFRVEKAYLHLTRLPQ